MVIQITSDEIDFLAETKTNVMHVSTRDLISMTHRRGKHFMKTTK